MSEQWTPTTDQVRSFYAHDSEDEYHDPIAYPSHVRSAEQAFDRWLAQVQREAAVKALREAADAALAVREAHCKVWPWPGSPEWSEAAHEYELTRVAFEQLRESPWGWIMDRADKLEGENK